MGTGEDTESEATHLDTLDYKPHDVRIRGVELLRPIQTNCTNRSSRSEQHSWLFDEAVSAKREGKKPEVQEKRTSTAATGAALAVEGSAVAERCRATCSIRAEEDEGIRAGGEAGRASSG